MKGENTAKDFEKKHLQAIKAQQAKVRKEYSVAIDKIYAIANKLQLKNGEFDINKYPPLKAAVQKAMSDFTNSMNAIIANGVKLQHKIAMAKNDKIDQIAVPKKYKKIHETLQAQRQVAANSFTQRQTNTGLQLSDRVWNYTNQFQSEIENNLFAGISEGKSAAQMAKDQKKYLKQPDALFRRVKNAEGKLVLSEAAKAYKPGSGVYRSSYKNAMRLTRTENNIAYRNADSARYESTKFILGFEVRLSQNHPKYDMCDQLAGKYPANFKFSGWHPQCLCYTVPVLPSEKEYEAYEDALLAGEGDDFRFGNVIDEVPTKFKEYNDKNAEKIAKMKSQPYWVRDNKEIVSEAMGIDIKPGELTKNQFTKAVRADIVTEDIFLIDGKYTAERKALHDKILEDYFANEEHADTDTIHMLGGAPANGKSTVVESGLLPHDKKSVVIDPDRVKAMIPEYNAMLNSGDPALIKAAANFVHEESSYLGKLIRAKSIQNNYATVLDGVNDGGIDKITKNVESVRKLAPGKKVRADYVSLDTDLSIKLANARSAKTGREVPLDFIQDMNKQISQVMPELLEKNVFDELYLWDTNAQGKPRLILKQVGGKLEIMDQELYKRFLSKNTAADPNVALKAALDKVEAQKPKVAKPPTKKELEKLDEGKPMEFYLDRNKNIKNDSDAEKRIQQMFGKNTKVDISNTMTPEMLQDSIGTLDYLNKNYYSSYKTLSKVSFKGSATTHGHISRWSDAILEADFGRRKESYWERSRQNRSLNRFASAVEKEQIHRSTVVHEWAHVITTQASAGMIRAAKKGKKPQMFFKKLEKIKEKYLKEIEKLTSKGNVEAAIDIFLGKYASTNNNEFMAEAFTEYILSKTPSKYAQEVGKLIDEYFKRE